LAKPKNRQAKRNITSLPARFFKDFFGSIHMLTAKTLGRIAAPQATIKSRSPGFRQSKLGFLPKETAI